MARLIVEKGHDKGKSIPLPSRATTVFGRDTTANVQIKDTMASRLHFRIEPRPDGLWLVDQGSMNGTLLNGHPAGESLLKPGDLIRVGETTYSFLADDEGTDPLIGQRLGGYKILERVGRGGMGTVYKAEQIDLQRIVALKIISEEHLKNPEFIDLFVHEARAAAKLNHPHIVQVYDVKKTNERYFFSMEFVPGGSVQDLLNNRRKLPIAATVKMILEAARGLDYAHKKEIIHRDVKPDNFMIGEGGAIKIGDLGLAQRLGEKLSADNEDSVIGTPHYIAPEQLLGRPADVRSDVYSLGSTMYRMIAGFTPFQAPSVRELVNKKAREEATPLHLAIGGIPESLGLICAKMMARLPEERTQTMSAVVSDLEAWSRAGDENGTAVRETPPVHRKLLLTAVALLGIVVVGGVIAATAMLKKEQPAPVAGLPGPSAADSESNAEAKLDRAIVEEEKLVDKKPDEFDGVIRVYESIVSRWPGTKYASDAERRMNALKTRRLGLMAARGLAALEALDLETWKQVQAGIQAGKEDFAEVDKRIKDFRAFAADPAWQGTDSAAAAARRAEAGAAWLAEVGKRRLVHEKLREQVEGLAAALRYKEAVEACNEFIAEVAAYAPASKDRYSTLLYDIPARRLAGSLAERADRTLEEAVQKAAALEAKGEFASALQAIEASVRHSLKEPSDRARKLIEELNQRWSAANQREAERATMEQKRLADLDRRDFDAAARRWREHILRFDPKPALAEAAGMTRSSQDRFPRLPAAEARLGSRVAPLRVLAEMKETLVRGLNEKPATVGNRITLDRRTGTILKASETHLTIDFGGGVEIEPSFVEILAGGPASAKTAQFIDYLRGAGRDAHWTAGVVVFCLELGLYERAVEELKPLEKSSDEFARKFLAEYRPMAEDFRFPDSDEIEAHKHFDRLQLALKDPGSRIDVAKTLVLLRTRFGSTDFYLAQKTRLDEIEKERNERELREKEKTVRAERYRKIENAKQNAQAQSKARETEIYRGLASLKDQIERGFHLGEAQFGFGNNLGSTKTLLDALNRALDKMPPADRRNPADPTLYWVARLGSCVMRNFHLQKQEARASDIRNRIDQKYGEEFGAWKAYKDAHEAWVPQVADRIKKHGDKLAALEKELVENPDAKTLYDLAEAHDVLRNAFEARGLYAAFLAEFPDHEKSKSADTHLRLAENTYQLRDVVKAEELYLKFKADFPNHPKITQASPFDVTSIENRLRSCNSLKNNMGLK